LLALNYIENRNSASTIVTSGQASYDVVNIPPLEIKRSDEIIIHVGRLLDDSLWGSYNLSKKDDINSDDLLDGFWYVFSRRDASDVFNSMMGSLELKINFAKNSSDVMMLTDLVDVVKPFCSSTYRHDLILAIQGMISILNEDKGQYDAMRNDYESENHANMGYWGNRYDNAKYIGFLRNIFQSLDDSNRTQIKRHIGRMGI
jgi:hypothetical protein